MLHVHNRFKVPHGSKSRHLYSKISKVELCSYSHCVFPSKDAIFAPLDRCKAHSRLVLRFSRSEIVAFCVTVDFHSVFDPKGSGRKMVAKKPGVIALFDVDGTLTAPRKVITPDMLEFMRQLREVVTVGVVGGSDLVKISEQLGKTVVNDYDFVFSENGLLAHKNGEMIGSQSLKRYLGEEKLREFINFTLHYIADLDIPIKRGTFIEFRSGMLNVSPIGRNCSQEERDEFEKYDKVHNVRSKMVSVLRETFAHFNLTFSIGGQISFDVFPQGWDKTYCLRYLDEFQEIHFFGDKTYKGGNDYEIYESERTFGHTVTSPNDTREQCKSLFFE